MEPDLSALRAEARHLIEKRESREIHCHIIGACAPFDRCSCERCLRGIPIGPNDWTTTIVHIGGDGDTGRHSIPRNESEMRETRASDGNQPPSTDAAPQEAATGPSDDPPS